MNTVISLISIKSRIYLSFIFSTLLLLVISLIAYQGIVSTQDGFKEFAWINKKSQDILNVELSITRLENSVEYFSYTGYEAIADKVIREMALLRVNLNNNRSEFSEIDIAKKYLDRMISHLDKYEEIFFLVIEEISKRKVIINELHLLERELIESASLTDSLRIKLIMIEKTLLEYLNDPDILKVNNAINILDEQIKLESGFLENRLIGYKKKYIEVVQSTRGFLFLTSVVMPAEAQEIEYLSDQLTKFILAKVEPVKLDSRNEILKTRNRIIFVSVTLLILLLFLYYLIANSICEPLLKLTNTFKNLANEKNLSSIPGLDLKDEIGEMSKAAEVFRLKNKETKKLLKELDVKKIDLEKSKNEIKQALNFNQLIMSNIPDLVFVKDSDFRIIQANDAFLSIYPETIRASVIGSTTVEDYEYAEAEKFLANDRKAFKEGFNEAEEKISFPDGKERILFTKKVRFEDAEGNQFILGVSRDISMRKEAERKLIEYNKNIRDQKEYYEALIYNLNIPAFVMNIKHEVVIWNKACEELTGMLSKNIVGTTDAWKAFYNEKRNLLADIIINDNDETINDLYPVSKSTSFIQRGHSVENWNPMPLKGNPRYVAIDAGPIYDENGKIIAVIEVIRDITELKEYQLQLEQRQIELERSNEELERFAYVASHDLQEPLRMVASYTSLLAKRYKDKLDDDANEFINYAVDGSKRMQTLINDLLTFSRLNAVTDDFSVVDTDQLVEELLYVLKHSIDEKNNVVVTKDKLPEVNGLEPMLAQLFQNIISNAVKYSDPKRKNEIHISAKKGGKRWIFSVSDTGIGIAPEYFEKIFVIFKRLHGREEYSGTGIGLALCKKIVEKHGGEIWLESVPDQGSTFIFTLLEK